MLQTDGLLDNLWAPDVQRVLGRHSFAACGLPNVRGDGGLNTTDATINAEGEKAPEEGCKGLLESIAVELAVRSHAVGEDPRAKSPFAFHARAASHSWRGGKMDDVVVVLGLVVEDDAKTSGSRYRS